MNLCKKRWKHVATMSAGAVLFVALLNTGMGQHDTLIIDDRTGSTFRSSLGGEWRLVTDGVMGGASTGKLKLEIVEDRPCLWISGDISLANNGGFVQAALDMPDNIADIGRYTGLLLDVYGNNESYNVHLRTNDNRLPWQSYRASFTATPKWTQMKFPFEKFTPYRTDNPLKTRNLARIGIVAIGREFEADVCVGGLAFY